jgi:outer membrane protein
MTLMNFKNILFSFSILLAFYSNNTFSQEKLTLEQAVATALKNNFDIRLVKNDVKILENNVNIGNAGILPSLTGNYGRGGSIQNTVQTQNTGAQRILNGVRNTNTDYGVALDWTIFDGFQMFANYDRLKKLQQQGEVNAKGTVITIVADVVNAYYTVVRQQRLVVAKDSALDVSNLRLLIANSKLEIGRGSKLDVLTAKVDYNADTSSYLQEKNLLKTSIITLNEIMARDLNTNVIVDEDIEIDNNLNFTDLASQAEKLNPALQVALLNKKLAELDLKVVKGQRYPIVGLNSGYEFSRSQSPTGFNQRLRANGFTYGVTASLNLFNGFLQRTSERNAKVLISSSDLTLDKTRQTINSQLLSAYQSYVTSLDLLKVETGNVEVAKQNLEITLDKYRLGSIAPLELREAQRNSIDAITRFLEAEYQAKLTEINLKEISGTLNVQ